MTDSTTSAGGATSSTADESMEGGQRVEERAGRKRKMESVGKLLTKKRKVNGSQVRTACRFSCSVLKTVCIWILCRGVKPLREVEKGVKR